MKVSARNQLKGKIVNINEGAVNAIISLDIGGGNIITSTISKTAVEDLKLQTVCAYWIEVTKEDNAPIAFCMTKVY